MILVLLEIAFGLCFIGLLIKALFETAYGIVLIITGCVLMIIGYALSFTAFFISGVNKLWKQAF